MLRSRARSLILIVFLLFLALSWGLALNGCASPEAAQTRTERNLEDLDTGTPVQGPFTRLDHSGYFEYEFYIERPRPDRDGYVASSHNGIAIFCMEVNR